MNSVLDDSLVHLLHRATQRADELFASKYGRQHRLTVRQLIVLAAVAADDGASQTSLVRRTGVDRSTLSDLVARLANRGLVRRRRSKADARAYTIGLTEAGLDVLRSALPVLHSVENELVSALSPDRKKEFVVFVRAANADDRREADEVGPPVDGGDDELAV